MGIASQPNHLGTSSGPDASRPIVCDAAGVLMPFKGRAQVEQKRDPSEISAPQSGQ